MSDSNKTIKSSRAGKVQSEEYELRKSLTFIEDLCWLLEANKEINYKTVSKQIRQLSNTAIHATSTTDNQVNQLIGILPTLLKDETIFSSNSNLVQFAKEVLGLELRGWDKKSRFELIGHIICNVEETNPNRINKLTLISAELLQNKEKVKKMQSDYKVANNIFSWNEAIQKIVGYVYE